MSQNNRCIHKLSRLSISAVVVLALLAVGGCSGPVWQFPGGKLEGEERALDLSAVPSDCGVIQLETNPDDPYSVNIGCRLIAGTIYVDPADSRTWYQNMKANPLVRIRFDGSEVIYLAKAETETNKEILDQYEADRHVLRLVPRLN